MKWILAVAGLGLALMTRAQGTPYCELHGAVYVTEDRSQADYIVYQEGSEAFADFQVYLEENKLYADEPGLWFMVDNRGISDFTVFFSKEKGNADFIIFIADTPTFVGCN